MGEFTTLTNATTADIQQVVLIGEKFALGRFTTSTASKQLNAESLRETRSGGLRGKP